jgi:hypothetical protein
MRFRRSGERGDAEPDEVRLRTRQYELAAEQARLRKEAEQRERMRDQFFESAPGQARGAFERGDRLFQFFIDVTEAGGSQVASTRDAAAVLNAVCDEGWELITGSFVSRAVAADAREKVRPSSQDAGTTVFGYYLFRRSEANKKTAWDPWDVAVIDRVCPHCQARIHPSASLCPECLMHSEPWRFDNGLWWRATDGMWEWLDPGTGDWHPKTQDVPAP